jgi:hypothetical protein
MATEVLRADESESGPTGKNEPNRDGPPDLIRWRRALVDRGTNILRQLPDRPRARTHNHFFRSCGLAIDKCPPGRNRAEGHHSCRQLSADILLLLVVHRRAFDLFALRIGSTRCGRAGLAIRRYYGSAADRNLSVFLDYESQCLIVNLLVRTRV